MKSFRLYIFLICIVGVISLLAACGAPATTVPTTSPTTKSPAATATKVALIEPGDKIGAMVLLTGPAESDGPLIWAFCPPAFSEEPGVITIECSVPPLPELPVGHGWFTSNEAKRDENWEAMTWELFIDDQPVELNAFGALDVDLPQTGLPGYDPDEEVITKLRTWDVLLSDLVPGAHTLRSVLHVSQDIDDGFHTTKAGTYELSANFSIEDTPPATPTPEPPTATPTPELPTATATQAFTLATTAEEIVGTWLKGSAYYIRFYEDGTFHQAHALDKLDSQSYAISEFWFEGTQMFTEEISVSGVPSCGKKTGIYEIRLLEVDNIQISSIKDQCIPRAGDTSGEFQPVR